MTSVIHSGSKPDAWSEMKPPPPDLRSNDLPSLRDYAARADQKGETQLALAAYERILGVEPEDLPAGQRRMALLAGMGRAGYVWEAFPDFVTLDNHRACNARCRMCPTQNIPLEAGRMDDALFETICEQLQCFVHRIRRVQFGVHGEPLLDRSLEQRVARIKALGVNVIGVVTNGSALTAKRARRLLEAGVTYFILALDGATAETFEQIRIGLSFETVRRNALELIRIRDEMDAKASIIIRIIEQPANRAEVQAWRAFWEPRVRPNWDSCSVVPMHSWAETLDGGRIDYGATPCGSVFGEIILSATGEVPLCCIDYGATHRFGSVRDAHLLDIFNHPRMAGIRELHINGQRGKVALCDQCIAPEGAVQLTEETERQLVWNQAESKERRSPQQVARAAG